jgi:phage-related holin
MNNIMEFLQGLITVDQARILIWLVAANLLLGVVVALKEGNFDWGRFKDFWKQVGIMFGIYLVVSLAAHGLGDFEPMRTVAFAGCIAYMAKRITEKLTEMGFSLPEKAINAVPKGVGILIKGKK